MTTLSKQDEPPLTERARQRIGQILLGKWRLDALLGVGGMAAVFEARHHNGSRVAIKILHPELSLSADIRGRFLREGHAANAVNHPGAVHVLDDNVAEDGSAFLVMELLRGSTVEALWEQRGRRLPQEMVLAIGHELCDVLAAAHAVAVIHRDVKPGNLFLTDDGVLKVLDYGIARLRDAATSHATATGAMMGTPAYMAPEQARGRASQIDGQTDVWAVGASMFTLLSGEIVHADAETPQHAVMLAGTEPSRSLASVAPHLDGRIVQIVDRALRFEKADRWPSAGAMRSAIRDAGLVLFGRTPVLPALKASDPAIKSTLPSAPDVNEVARAPERASRPVIADRAHAAVSTAAAVPATVRDGPAAGVIRVLGSTTATPVSSEAETVPHQVTPQPRRSRLVVAVLAGGACVGIATALAVRTVSVEPPPTTAASVPMDMPATSATEAGSMAVGIREQPAMSATPPAVGPLPGVARPPATGVARPAAVPAKAPSTSLASPAAAVPPNCKPPYTTNAAGIRFPKPECN